MAGLVCLVTGATSGIGQATALEFARRGAIVGMVARSKERGNATLDLVTGATGNENVHLLLADLGSQSAVRALSDDFARRFDGLDVLVNAAAVFEQDRRVTEEGLELMFATNLLAPFLLTMLLMPQLRAQAPAHVLNITAPSTVRPDFLDLQGERRFRPTRAFGASKAGELLLTFALSRRLSSTGVTVNAYHPGIVRTGLMRNAPLPMRLMGSVLSAVRGREPETVGGEIADLATSPLLQETSGRLIHQGRVIMSPFEDDVEAQEQLFRACEELTGVRYRDQL